MSAKTYLGIGIVLSVFVGYAATTAVEHKLTPEQKREMTLERTGGLVNKPGTQKGEMIVLDTQKTVEAAPLKELIAKVADITRYNIHYEAGELPGNDCAAFLKSHNAVAMIAIVYDDVANSLLIAPDEHWAIINLKKLERNLNDAGKKKFLTPRSVKQLCRAFALIGGSACQFKQSPGSAYSIEDLDNRGDMVPMDQIQQLSFYLGHLGMRPQVRTSYRKAVQDGWAPAPTNDYQKAIWEKLHEIPTEPMTIKPEKHPAK